MNDDELEMQRQIRTMIDELEQRELMHASQIVFAAALISIGVLIVAIAFLLVL